jgi:hypothetical protein
MPIGRETSAGNPLTRLALIKATFFGFGDRGQRPIIYPMTKYVYLAINIALPRLLDFSYLADNIEY